MSDANEETSKGDIVIAGLKGFQLSTDLAGARLTWIDRDKKEVSMQVSSSYLQGVMQELLVKIQEEKQKATGGKSFVKLNVVEGGVGSDDSNNVIVHFTPESGVQYNFSLNQEAAQLLYDTLGKVLDIAEHQTPPKKH